MALGTAKGIFEIEFEPIATHGIASMNGNTCQRVAAILCIGGPDVIRKEAWPVYRKISGVRLLGARRT
jgi:hypothetical protein